MVMASMTGRAPAWLVIKAVRVVVPTAPDVWPAWRTCCCMMGSASQSVRVDSMLMPAPDAKLVTVHVPAALDLQALTAQLAPTPGSYIMATVCPAVERASTMTMGSAQPAMSPARLVWGPSPLTAPRVRAPRRDCRWDSSWPQSPPASVCPSAVPSFTWRALGCVKLVMSHVCGVWGRATMTALPAGHPTCCWKGSASLSVRKATSARQGAVQNATQPVGSAMGRWNLTVPPVTLMSLLAVGTARPVARQSSSSTSLGTVQIATPCASTVWPISRTLGVSA